LSSSSQAAHGKRGQRRQVLPNPGCLDKIEFDEAKRNLELILKPGKSVFFFQKELNIRIYQVTLAK
jgi:hypothetical protein